MTPNKLMEMMAAKKASMKKTEKTAKLAPGVNQIRLLPGWRGDDDPTWFHDFGQHYIKDAADQIQAVYLCTQGTFEKECAVCGALAMASRAAGDDATTEILAKAKASRSVLINALMLDSTEPNTPVILEIKRGLFEQLVDIIIEYEGSPLDPNLGMIIKINRDGKGLATKYTAMPTAKVLKIAPASLLKINNLDDYVKQESEEQERRAIGAINGIAGILPAPAPGADRPTTRASLAAPAVFDDIPDFEDVTPAAGGVSLDADLDALLNDLPS